MLLGRRTFGVFAGEIFGPAGPLDLG
jgi:hypothetical protein